MNATIKKSYKILGLSFAILILALLFFFWRGRELYRAVNPVAGHFQLAPLSPGFTEIGGSESPLANKPRADSYNLTNLPPPANFSSFSYNPLDQNGKKTLDLEIECQDAYYAVLIFNIKDDYRQNSGAARFNQAAPCQIGEKIERSIDLEKLNLSAGKYYYIVADQGLTGSWYNPR